MICTAGYQAGWTVDQLRSEAERLDAWLIDIRHTPWSQRPDMRGVNLRRALPERYVHVAELGNRNHANGGAIELVDASHGAARIAKALTLKPAVILLCGCRNAWACHRSVAAELVAGATGHRVEHLEPPIGDGCIKAISVCQPWAWLIIYGGKDIENRDWGTGYRGLLAIHASKGMTRAEYEDAADFAEVNGVTVPAKKDLVLGAIIGTVRLVACVRRSESPWFCGDYGLELANPRPLRQLVPAKGMLGLWDWIPPGGGG